MRQNLRPGEKFPDIELPSQDGELTKLSSLMGGFPTGVVFRVATTDRRMFASWRITWRICNRSWPSITAGS